MGLFKKIKAMFVHTAKSRGDAKLQRADVSKRFDLLGRTGQGSMSKVWRARDRTLGRTICLKLLDKEKTAKFEARFPGLTKPKEGAVCMQLRHKNIVQTHEYGITTAGEYYLVMDLIEGMGFNYLLETKNQQARTAAVTSFMVQMADAVEYVHSQGFLHRDIRRPAERDGDDRQRRQDDRLRPDDPQHARFLQTR